MNSLAPEATRRVVRDESLVSDLCMLAFEQMLKEDDAEQMVTVLHKGTTYFFRIECAGFRPPYQTSEATDADADADAEIIWVGQREN